MDFSGSMCMKSTMPVKEDRKLTLIPSGATSEEEGKDAKKNALSFSATRRAIHTFHKKVLSVLINKHTTRDRKSTNNSSSYTVLQKQSFSFLIVLCVV